MKKLLGSFLFVSALGITLVASSCPPCACVPPPPPAAPPGLGGGLRPGVQVLDSLQGSSNFVYLADVEQAGAEIAALVSENCATVLFLSPDEGQTWTRHPLHVGCTSFMQVHLSSVPGHVTLVAELNSLGNPYYQFSEVNLATNTVTIVPGGMREGFLYYRGDQIVSYDNVVDNSGTASYRFFTYTVSTQTFAFTGGQYATNYGGCQAHWWGSIDGRTFKSFCYAAPNSWCELAVNTDTTYVPITACVYTWLWPPLAEYNAPSLVHRLYFLGSGVLAEAFRSLGHAYTNGHAYLATLSSLNPATVAPPIDLGVGGFPYDAVAASNHLPYGSMVPLTPDRLIRVPASGPPVSIPIPLAACAGQNNCAGAGGATQWAYGQVRWVVPLANDDYLVFYAWYRGDDPFTNSPQIICVSREHALSAPL